MGKDGSWKIELMGELLQFSDLKNSFSIKTLNKLIVNKLYNIAIVFDLNTSLIKIYVNGVLDISDKIEKQISEATTKFKIGNSEKDYYKGILYNVMIWDDIISDYQCKHNYYYHPLYLYNTGVIRGNNVSIFTSNLIDFVNRGIALGGIHI